MLSSSKNGPTTPSVCVESYFHTTNEYEIVSKHFYEKTIAALRYYKEENMKPWSDTADFLEIILKLWNVLNVKSEKKINETSRWTLYGSWLKDLIGSWIF